MQIKNFNNIKPLLFNNVTIKQTIFKNTFWLTVTVGVSLFLKFILFIYIARVLGATEYGKFTFALSFVLLFQVFADFGLSQIITREFSKAKEQEKEFSALLSLKIVLSIVILSLILVLSLFITSDSTVQKIIWILAISNLISAYFIIFYAFFRARQKMEYEGLIRILEALVLFGIGFFVIFHFPSIQNLSYSYLIASLFSLVFILIFFNSKINQLSLSWNKSIWKKYLIMSWPLALIAFSDTIYSQIDSVMMGSFNQITQTGWYNAASRIIVVVTVPVGLISMSFYPALSKALKKGKEEIQKIWNYHMELMILSAIPLMVGGIVLAPRIIDYLFGSGFSPAILVFQILILMAGVMFLYHPFLRPLIVFDQQKRLFWITASGSVINVILNSILIPKFSLYGAAVATVVTNILILLLLMRSTLKFTTVNYFNSKVILNFIGATFCSIMMCFVLIQPTIYYLNVILTIFIGVIVYSTFLLGYRKLTSNLKVFNT